VVAAEEEVVPPLALAHSSRRSLVEARQAEQPAMPQEQVALRCWGSKRTTAGQGLRVWQGSKTRVQSVLQVAMPVPELRICSCILWSKVVRQEAEGRRRL
jgi:hypothetical protein